MKKAPLVKYGQNQTQTQTLRTFQYWGCTQMYSNIENYTLETFFIVPIAFCISQSKIKCSYYMGCFKSKNIYKKNMKKF